MRFNSEEEAFVHWSNLYDFHGEDLPENTTEAFDLWKQENDITFLDEELQEFIGSWKGVF